MFKSFVRNQYKRTAKKMRKRGFARNIISRVTRAMKASRGIEPVTTLHFMVLKIAFGKLKKLASFEVRGISNIVALL